MDFAIPFESINLTDSEFFMFLGLAFRAIPDVYLNMVLVGLLIAIFGVFFHFVIKS